MPVHYAINSSKGRPELLLINPSTPACCDVGKRLKPVPPLGSTFTQPEQHGDEHQPPPHNEGQPPVLLRGDRLPSSQDQQPLPAQDEQPLSMQDRTLLSPASDQQSDSAGTEWQPQPTMHSQEVQSMDVDQASDPQGHRQQAQHTATGQQAMPQAGCRDIRFYFAPVDKARQAQKGPSSKDQLPEIDGHGLGKQQAAVARQQPAVAQQQPAVARQQPAVSHQQRAVAQQQPAVAQLSDAVEQGHSKTSATQQQQQQQQQQQKATSQEGLQPVTARQHPLPTALAEAHSCALASCRATFVHAVSGPDTQLDNASSSPPTPAAEGVLDTDAAAAGRPYLQQHQVLRLLVPAPDHATAASWPDTDAQDDPSRPDATPSSIESLPSSHVNDLLSGPQPTRQQQSPPQGKQSYTDRHMCCPTIAISATAAEEEGEWRPAADHTVYCRRHCCGGWLGLDSTAPQENLPDAILPPEVRQAHSWPLLGQPEGLPGKDPRKAAKRAMQAAEAASRQNKPAGKLVWGASHPVDQ